MKRIYTNVIKKHLDNYNQMVFVSGPRQVGKTTISKVCAKNFKHSEYLNWDNVAHRKQILSLLEESKYTNQQLSTKHLLILDELHKYKSWKNYVKGFYDTYKDKTQIIVTGSARLNIYKKGGDSLMGRYFNYTVHPFSVGEVIRTTLPTEDVQPQKKCSDKLYDALYNFGGYPDPFLKQDKQFHKMWQDLRFHQIFREEIQSTEDIKALSQLEVLAHTLQEQVGGVVNYTTLASKIQVSNITIRKWVKLLESFYFCFTIKPWRKNISRSLIKEPKVYLWDWSVIEDGGMKFENFIVSHLLKSVTFWNETGLGDYGLYYLRTKDKQEIDFVITKNRKPWILVEAKQSNNSPISKHLIYFKEKINAPFAFQVVHNLDYVDKSCFDVTEPVIVPAKTFLSQLI